MSQVNGTGKTSLRKVREERQLLEEQIKLDHLQSQKKLNDHRAKLLENWSWYTDYFPTTFGSPLWDRIRGRDETDRQRVPPAVPSDRRHGQAWPIYRSQQELEEFRQASRILCYDNGYARGMLLNRQNYIISTGFKYKAASREQTADADPKAPGKQDPEAIKNVEQILQRFLDRWMQRVRWSGRERETFRRTNRDFESFLRLFFADDGSVDIRFVEPEQVIDPPGATVHDGWSFGIRHRMAPAEDVESIEEYHVVYQDSSTAKPGDTATGELVPANEMVHVKSPETDCNLKRGAPVFYGDTMNAFVRASQLQKAISIGSQVRAATAEWWSYEFGTETQVSSLVADKRNHEQTDPVTGKVHNVERVPPGTIRHLPDGIKPNWPLGSSGVPEYIQGVQADLRLAGAAFAAPEYMVSGDASNANLASTLVASAPVVRAAEAEQEYYKTHFLEVINRVIAHAVEKGKLPKECLTLVEVQCEPPKVIHRDMMQQAHVDQIYVLMGAKDRQTVCMELGLDWERVKTNNVEWEELYPAFKDIIPPYPSGGGGGKGGGAGGGGGMRAPPGVGDQTRSMMTARESVLTEGEGTCKPGERADLTGCTPATADQHVQTPANDDEPEDLDERLGQLMDIDRRDARELSDLDHTEMIRALSGKPVDTELWDVENIKGLDRVEDSSPIADYNDVSPIIIGPDGDLIDGHHRLSGLIAGGQDTVRVIRASAEDLRAAKELGGLQGRGSWSEEFWVRWMQARRLHQQSQDAPPQSAQGQQLPQFALGQTSEKSIANGIQFATALYHAAHDVDSGRSMRLEHIDDALLPLAQLKGPELRQVALNFQIFDAPRSKTAIIGAIASKIKGRITFHQRARVSEAAGTCKAGERADLTGCTPADLSKNAGQKSSMAHERPAGTNKLPPQEGHEQWKAALSSEEMKAINVYTTDWYRAANNRARRCPEDLSCLPEEDQKTFQQINEAIEKHPPFDKPRVLYRGISLKPKELQTLLQDFKEAGMKGHDVTFYGITSMSSKQQEAFGFANGVLFEIEARSGAYVDGLSEIPAEEEFIHKHGQRYQVVGMVKQDNGELKIKLRQQ